MKRITLITIMFILLLFGGDSVATENTIFSSTEVSQSGIADTLNSSMTDEEKLQPQIDGTQSSNVLIAYFSRTGENYDVGYIEKGNTSIVADIIAEQTNGDLFEIRTLSAYPDNYDEATEVAKQEQNTNARPELAESLNDISDYDVVFIGYPIWWSDMPMAVYTFLESHDLSEKTIVPFCTHAGSGLAFTESTISSMFPNAAILDGLAISGTTAQNNYEETERAVIAWLRENNIL